MSTEFRCENCGKLLNVEAEPSSKIKCPYCKAKIMVPAGLASLPRPQVPGGDNQTGNKPLGAASAGEADVRFEEEPVSAEQDALMGVMAMLMPWIISLFFHVGVMVIMAFITIVMLKSTAPADVTAPNMPISERLSRAIRGGRSRSKLRTKSHSRAKDRWSKRDSRIPADSRGKTKSKVSLYDTTGGQSGGGSNAPTGRITGGKSGPRTRFGGTKGNAYHVVYVVDRSGSMLDTFDEVRMEITTSLCQLSAKQTFHVIFFAAGTPKENPPGRLVFATEANKTQAVTFLEKITPEGQTDPIPALNKAFSVLKNTPGDKKGKLINLLTDGEFPDNEKVLKAIKAGNARGDVQINTVLHHHRCEEAIKVLKQIADQNRGEFNFVEPNE